MSTIILYDCQFLTDRSITSLLTCDNHLRCLRMKDCELVTDRAFLDLPKPLNIKSLSTLDLSGCEQLHDKAVEKIIDGAPGLHRLVLNKCRKITDRAVFAIAKLGENLRCIHLGHCRRITDDAVKKLVKYCSRIQCIDLASCKALTDTSVTLLAGLSELRSISLVRCNDITDRSILALAKTRSGRLPKLQTVSLLERVFLSYCTRLKLQGIHVLLKQCPALTHLSLTGISTFYLREDFTRFCRQVPAGK